MENRAVGVVGMLHPCCLPKRVRTHGSQEEDVSHESFHLFKMKCPFLEGRSMCRLGFNYIELTLPRRSQKEGTVPLR